MNTIEIERAFEKIGAKIDIEDLSARRWGRTNINVRNDKFSLQFLSEEDLKNMRLGDIQPGMRHLLLKINGNSVLCGHDERHWFAASVPGAPSGVKQAMEHLKPTEVREAERAAGVSTSKKLKRRNAARKRQGEWFFIPRPDMIVNEDQITRNEMLQRNPRSQAHVCEEMYAPTGTTVMVKFGLGGGQLSMDKYYELPASEREGWRPRTLTNKVYVRGAVRHPDHATLTLNCWHETVLSSEGAAGVGQTVAFLD